MPGGLVAPSHFGASGLVVAELVLGKVVGKKNISHSHTGTPINQGPSRDNDRPESGYEDLV